MHKPNVCCLSSLALSLLSAVLGRASQHFGPQFELPSLSAARSQAILTTPHTHACADTVAACRPATTGASPCHHPRHINHAPPRAASRHAPRTPLAPPATCALRLCQPRPLAMASSRRLLRAYVATLLLCAAHVAVAAAATCVSQSSGSAQVLTSSSAAE